MIKWLEHYEYRPDGRLFSKNRRGKFPAGREEGWVDVRGYVRTKLFGKMTFAHRIIWEMHNGEIPEGMEIDHINGIKHDNRIENLRAVDRFINCKNAAKRKDNVSGFTGVSYSSAKSLWIVQIQCENKRTSSHHVSKESAIAEAQRIYATLDGFTDRHGK